MPKKFLRRDTKRYLKLGKRRKKKQSWRKPTGRDNKMREKRKSYPKVVSIGYKQSNKIRRKIMKNGKIIIKNLDDNEVPRKFVIVLTCM